MGLGGPAGRLFLFRDISLFFQQVNFPSGKVGFIGIYDGQLDAQLVPYPGTVLIDSDAEGLKLLLNDSAYYLSGGTERVIA